MVNQLALMTGIDIPLPELAVSIHQPSIKDISFIGEDKYFLALQYICFQKNMLCEQNPMGKLVLENMNNFQIFLMMVQGDSSAPIAIDHKKEVAQLFKLFFPQYDLQFLPRSLILFNAMDQTSIVIDENNFDIIRDTINDISGLSAMLDGDSKKYKPVGKRAAEIAEKLAKAQALRGKKDGSQGSALARYVSVLTIGLNDMSLQDCLNLTVYQLYDLIERYGLYTAWDIDIRSRLAGGKPDEQPDDWMKNLH